MIYRSRNIYRVIIFAVIGTLLLILGANKFGGNLKGYDGRIVTDLTGRAVVIPISPQRVLSLCTNATDIMIDLGLKDRLAAVDQYNRIVRGSEDAEVVGKESALSKERIIYSDIDVAFLWWYQNSAAELLESLGVPVIFMPKPRVADIADTIRFIGECMGSVEQASLRAYEIERYLAEKQIEKPQRKVYFELYSPLKTVGGGTFIDDLLRLAGYKNIAGDVNGSVVLSIEKLIEADPDIIFFIEGFAEIESIKSRNGFESLRAVRQGNIYALDRRDILAGAGLMKSVENIKNAAN